MPLFLHVLLFFACHVPVAAPPVDALPRKQFGYNLDKPDATFYMPADLSEISALSMAEDGKHLLALQDEKGTVYYIDTKSGEVDARTPFWKSGDYEGIEVAQGKIFALKSTGTLYEIDLSDGSSLLKHKGFLNESFNVEGLGFDAGSNKLLLACKEHGDLKKTERGVYAFSLDHYAFDSLPFFTIRRDSLLSFLHAQKRISKKTLAMYEEALVRKDDLLFSPSAIAVHPLTKEIFVASTAGAKAILAFDRHGSVKRAALLDKSVHRQPEGLAFDAKGNLYISNEGKKGTGKIYRFDYKPKK